MRRAVRHRRALVGAAVGLGVLGGLSSGMRAVADPPRGGGAVPKPQLGTADRPTVIMGGARAGDPGEAWAYRVLPLDTPPPAVPGGSATFADPPRGSAFVAGQLVFERATDADPNWNIAQTPLDRAGRPYRGMQPNRLSARITARAGGLLVGQDSTRAANDQVVVLLRQPGDRYRQLPDPPPGVLMGANQGGDPNPEVLAEGSGSGRVVVAAVDGQGRSQAFLGALGRAQETAVIHWDGNQWTREPIDLPAGYRGTFRIEGIDGTAPANMWLLGLPDPSSGRGIFLFHRNVDASGSAHWDEAPLGTPLFAQSATASRGVTSVAPQVSPAQPLTVTERGVWIDGSLTSSGGSGTGGSGTGGSGTGGSGAGGSAGGADFTLYYDIAQGSETSSWCDAHDSAGAALCDHPLGARFGRRSGYRSFAFAGPGFGTRLITNPLLPGGDDASNLGTYLRFDDARVSRLPGGGTNDAPSGAFSGPDDGWLQGPVQITPGGVAQRLTGYPVATRAPFNGVAPAPGQPAGAPGSQALTVGSDGAVARYKPGQGWQREFLLSSTGAVSSPTLRSVAWPEPGRAYAVGDVGAMWLWRAETGLWQKDPAAPVGTQANMLGVAFDPSNSARGFVVGLGGTLLRYDKTWTQEVLPAGFATRDLTSVAFAGSEAMATAGSDLLVNTGGAWQVDPGVHQLLRTLPGAAVQLNVVAGLPDGGAVVAGRNLVIERDGAGAPWRFADQPIVGETAVAAAAYRDGRAVRAVVATVPSFQYPPTLQLPPQDPNTPPPLIPPNPLPGDGYVLRETAGGWEDEQRAAFAGVSNDRPLKVDPVAGFDLSPDGSGWAVGGWSGQADEAGRGTAAAGGTGAQIRRRVQTTGIFRFAPGADAPAPPGAAAAPIALDTRMATFAVAGHAQCESTCADLSARGLAPDRNLSATLATVGALTSRPGGPRALLYTGGRVKPGGGSESPADLARYAQLLGGGPPAYAAVSAADSEGGSADGFSAAFAGFAAPFGQGGAPAGIDTSNGASSGPARPGARTHYAFDSTGSAGTVRVVVIDNSRGSLQASDAYQNPSEAQGPWLTGELAAARRRGVPAIVQGSRELNPNLTPPLNVASDATTEAQLLVSGGASAYLYERPEETRTSRIPSGASTTIPEFGTGTLGYRSPVTRSFTAGQPDALFGSTGFLLVAVDVAARSSASNVAPVSARLIPLIQGLSLDSIDGTLLRRSRPALFQGLGRRPVAGDRWGPPSASDGNPNPPGGDPYTSFPPDPCVQSNCSSAVNPEFRFSSSDPDIADFVQRDPNSTNLRKPFQDPAGRVVPSSSSDLLCAFNAGTTTVTVSAGGLSFAQQVTVLNGSVQQPCGTVPLNASRFKRSAEVAVPAPPTPPPPAPAPAPAPVAPPPPPHATPPLVSAAPAVRAAVKPPSPPRAGLPAPSLFAPPMVQPPVQGAIPAFAPPPAGGFARPIPPGGATIRAFEDRREEEAAPEQSQAFSAYHVDAHGGGPPLALYLLGAAVLAAAAGASLRLGPRRREHRQETAIAAARIGASPRPLRRRP